MGVNRIARIGGEPRPEDEAITEVQLGPGKPVSLVREVRGVRNVVFGTDRGLGGTVNPDPADDWKRGLGMEN